MSIGTSHATKRYEWATSSPSRWRGSGSLLMDAIAIAVLVGEDRPPAIRLLRRLIDDGDTILLELGEGGENVVHFQHHASGGADARQRALIGRRAGLFRSRFVEQDACLRALRSHL